MGSREFVGKDMVVNYVVRASFTGKAGAARILVGQKNKEVKILLVVVNSVRAGSFVVLFSEGDNVKECVVLQRPFVGSLDEFLHLFLGLVQWAD